MRILVTGALGFVGRNLCERLENIRAGRLRTPGLPEVTEVMRYDLDSPPEELEEFCRRADFVFNLAGVNRPEDPAEFREGNFGFASTLLDTLARLGNKAPVMLSSSVQATLQGRFAGSPYGVSKRDGEELFFSYSERNGVPVMVYRFPNLFGKWCRPNYNSAVATFCHNIARGLPIRVDNPATELDLVYIDDVMDEMLRAIGGHPSRCRYEGLEPVADPAGRYCHVPVSHRATLGEITGMLHSFARQPSTLDIPEIPAGSLAKKLWSTYLSYLPADKVRFPLRMNTDARGSFTELLHTVSGGQVSVNVSRPGITKGEHWHDSKWEFFIVVSGHALIRMRRIGDSEVLEFEVSGERIEAVHMLPGYTHNIINLSDTDDLVTVMWCNETFDPGRPDTYHEPVVPEQ